MDDPYVTVLRSCHCECTTVSSVAAILIVGAMSKGEVMWH